MKTNFTIPLAILFGGVIVAGAMYLSLERTQPPISSNTGNPALVRPVNSTDHILGNPAAPVKIIEYADFDCDYCRDFSRTMHKVIADAGVDGKVAWVYRQFPLIELHPNALKHAEASECVAKVAGDDSMAFWRFADALYANQPADPLRYGTLTTSVGVSGDAFVSCYGNAAIEVDARILADRQNALDAGAQGAPYSLIVVDGRTPVVLDGAYTYDAVRQVLDQVLAKLPSSTSSSR